MFAVVQGVATHPFVPPGAPGAQVSSVPCVEPLGLRKTTCPWLLAVHDRPLRVVTVLIESACKLVDAAAPVPLDCELQAAAKMARLPMVKTTLERYVRNFMWTHPPRPAVIFLDAVGYL
jgi:hypothetical protein